MCLTLRAEFLSCMVLVIIKSFAWLVSRVVGLFYTPQGVKTPTTRETSRANDFVNAKSHAKEKPLLAG